MGSLVFVTSELSPFTPGGIGRVLHNMLKTMSAEDRARSYVLMLDGKVEKSEFQAVFPGARLITALSTCAEGRYENGGHHPPRWAYSNTDSHWKSAVIYRELRTLAKVTPIDYLEFPDWDGLGFTTIQEKKISGFLSHAVIAVRLHSTHAMLLHHQATLVSAVDRNLVDLERKALRDCDVVVAQLRPVAERTRNILAIDEKEWSERLIIHSPPILLDTVAAASVVTPASPDMAVMFGSKIQRIKRPDLFVRGFAAFCNEFPDYRGDALVSAHSAQDEYGDSIHRLIPEKLKSRFHFSQLGQTAVREPMIAGSTFVVPSDFESFCLVAYEASLLGARVILNGKNPAFGDDTPWVDGVNCHKFDGTSLGLSHALAKNFNFDDEMKQVSPPSHAWPWARNIAAVLPIESEEVPLVSVVIPHFNLGQYLPQTLVSVLEQTYPNIEIIVVDDCSTEPGSQTLISELQSSKQAMMRMIVAPGNIGLAAARNLGIANSNGKYLVTLDADDVIDCRFIKIAVDALQRNPDFNVVVSPAGVFLDGSSPVLPGEHSVFYDYGVFVGESMVAGLLENRFSTATAVFRTNVIKVYGYVEALQSHEDMNLYFRLAQDGHRFLVTTEVYFYYRNRPSSMIKNAMQWDRRSLFMHDHLRTAFNANRMAPLAYLALCPERSTVSEMQHLDAIYQSWSWRITKPLRVALDLILKIKDWSGKLKHNLMQPLARARFANRP